MIRRIAAAAAVTIVIGLAGCTESIVGRAVACPGWVHAETPADLVQETDAVLIATVVEAAGTERLMEVDMNAWTLEVDDVIVGSPTVVDGRVRVVSMADPCSGTARYDGGDPLDAPGARLLVFVNDIDGMLSTPTPYQGVIPAPDDGRIPTAWP